MKSALLCATALLRLAPARGFVNLSLGPIQRHRWETAKHTFSSTQRREPLRLVRPPTALALASGAEAGLFSSLSLANAEAGLLSSPVFWSVSVMLTIVGLLRRSRRAQPSAPRTACRSR